MKQMELFPQPAKTFPREMIVSDDPDFPVPTSARLEVLAEVPSLEYCFLTKGSLYPWKYEGYKYAKEID